jgi:hypothetical protein
VRYVEVVHRREVSGFWAESPQMHGWSAADMSHLRLFAVIAEAVRLHFPDEEVDVRHRWAGEPGRHPVIAMEGTTSP